ncbi:MAG: DUF4388 domain-containing protein [Deltaproteobacteria bacterium]|nr:DUF4388 domain-containing protein [Deltaproteobacteria bacterium]
MAWYRDGIIWFAHRQELANEAPNLKIGALCFQTEQPDAIPALRGHLRFEVIVETRRLGPFDGEVVHKAGQLVGLQVAADVASALRRLADQLTGVAPGPQESGTFPIVSANDSTPGAAARDPGHAPADRTPTGAVERLSAPTGAVEVASGQALWSGTLDRVPPSGEFPALGAIPPLKGQLAGRLGLGALAGLVDSHPPQPPPERASLVHLMRYLAHSRARGKLTVRGEVFTKTVWFRNGVPMKVTVSPVKEDEQLGQILLKAKLVTPNKLADVMRWARTNRTQLGQAMVDSGVLDSARLNHALAHQTYRRLQDLFGWSGATFDFTAGVLPQGEHHPVSVPRLMVELAQEILRSARLEDLQVLLEPYNDRYPLLRADAAEELKLLVPDDKTRRIAHTIFDGLRPLRQAITVSVLGRPKTMRVVHLLIAGGALDLPLDPHTGGPPTAQSVQERLSAVEVQDAFQRLGVTYTADPDTLIPAYHRRMADHQPGSPAHQANPTASAKIQQLVDEAMLLLSTPSARQKYRQRIPGKEKLALFTQLVQEEHELAALMGQTERAARLKLVLEELAT